MFTPAWWNDPIVLIFLSKGWFNHQLVEVVLVEKHGVFFVESFQVIPPQMVLAFVETFGVLHVALAEKVLDKICHFEEGPDPKISEKCPKITSEQWWQLHLPKRWFQLLVRKFWGFKRFEHQPLMRDHALRSSFPGLTLVTKDFPSNSYPKMGAEDLINQFDCAHIDIFVL